MSEDEDRQREEAVKAKREFESLLEHPAWIRMSADLTEQLNVNAQALLSNHLADSSSIYKQEFDKGQLVGIQFVLKYPEGQIEMNQDIKEAIDERPSED